MMTACVKIHLLLHDRVVWMVRTIEERTYDFGYIGLLSLKLELKNRSIHYLFIYVLLQIIIFISFLGHGLSHGKLVL